MALLEKITLTCRKATFFSALAAEGKLRGISWLRYRMHLVICVACRRFSRQADSVCNAAKSAHEAKHLQCPEHLKAAIKDQLRKAG